MMYLGMYLIIPTRNTHRYLHTHLYAAESDSLLEHSGLFGHVLQVREIIPPLGIEEEKASNLLLSGAVRVFLWFKE